MPEITFKYIGDYSYSVAKRPAPAQSFMPEWFRKMESYDKSSENPSGNKLLVRDGYSNATAKKCTPMLDAITGGYVIPLWADIQVTQTDGDPILSWRVQKEVFDLHGPSGRRIPPPPGFSPVVFKYLTWLRIETPAGYSTMIKPPAGHYDSPFHPVSATVDTDKSLIDSNIPLWIASDFEGIIEKGTPVAQVFPFKRESWSSKFDVMTDEQYMYEREAGVESTIKNNYIKNIWSKKSYK